MIRKLLAEDGSGMMAATPLVDTFLLSNEASTPDTSYLSRIGTLLYIAQGIRPDILFETHYLARFSLNPDETHWAALQRLIAYVRPTQHYEFCVEPKDSEEPLKVYVDASWMGEAAYTLRMTGVLVDRAQ